MNILNSLTVLSWYLLLLELGNTDLMPRESTALLYTYLLRVSKY